MVGILVEDFDSRRSASVFCSAVVTAFAYLARYLEDVAHVSGWRMLRMIGAGPGTAIALESLG